MNLLINRALPESIVQAFVSEFAHHTVKVLHPSEAIDPHLSWAEAIVGNPSPQSILEHAGKLQWLQLLSSGFDGYHAFANVSFQVTTAHGIHAPIIAEQCLIGMLSKKVHANPAFIGLCCGFAFAIYMGFFTDISFLWYGSFAAATTAGLTWILSFFLSPHNEH